MIGIRKVFGFLMALAFVLSSGAAFAANDKTYTLTVSRASTLTSPLASPVTLVFTFTATGNSTFNSLTLLIPSGYTADVAHATADRGIVSAYPGGLQLNGINVPVGTPNETVNVTLPGVTNAPTCGVIKGVWLAQPWTGTPIASGQKFTILGTEPPADYTSYLSNTCNTVSYDGNGSTGGSAPAGPIAYAPGATVTVLSNTYSKANSTFDHWNTMANNLGTSYAPTAQFSMPAASVTLYAQWVPNVLSIVAPAPTSAAVNSQFSVTVGASPTGAAVSANTASCDNATIDATAAPTFKFTIPVGSLITSCTINFSATNYLLNPLPLTLPVYKGVLNCNGFDSSLGNGAAGIAALDPNADQSYIIDGGSGWGLSRGPNKDGKLPCVLVNYSCDVLATTPSIATCTWDKSTRNTDDTGLEQPTFKYVFVFPAIAAGSDGWPAAYHPWATWHPSPAATPGWPTWMNALACVNDMFPAIPTWALPIIPNVSPYSDGTNSYGPYQPFVPSTTTPQLAMVCVAQQGWTSVSTPDGSATSRPINIQWWIKVIDEADIKLSGP